jgi:hypothetical protein
LSIHQPASGGTAVPNPPFTIKNVIAHVEVKCTQMTTAAALNNMYAHDGQPEFSMP